MSLAELTSVGDKGGNMLIINIKTGKVAHRKLKALKGMISSLTTL